MTRSYAAQRIHCRESREAQKSLLVKARVASHQQGTRFVNPITSRFTHADQGAHAPADRKANKPRRALLGACPASVALIIANCDNDRVVHWAPRPRRAPSSRAGTVRGADPRACQSGTESPSSKDSQLQGELHAKKNSDSPLRDLHLCFVKRWNLATQQLGKFRLGYSHDRQASSF